MALKALNGRLFERPHHGLSLKFSEQIVHVAILDPPIGPRIAPVPHAKRMSRSWQGLADIQTQPHVSRQGSQRLLSRNCNCSRESHGGPTAIHLAVSKGRKNSNKSKMIEEKVATSIPNTSDPRSSEGGDPKRAVCPTMQEGARIEESGGHFRLIHGNYVICKSMGKTTHETIE
jgi:hypothetical protein